MSNLTANIREKILRRLSPHVARREVPVDLERPLVSLTFDDCPQSVIQNALPMIEQEGWTTTLYLSCKMCSSDNHLGRLMDEADIRPAHESGHEIGDHTFSHLDAFEVSPQEYLQDIEKNQETLARLGVPESRTFAYPYGQINPTIKRLMGHRFSAARGITAQTHTDKVDLNQIGSAQLYHGVDIEHAITRIKNMSANPGWLTLFSHDVAPSPSKYGCTPDDLRRILKALKDVDAEVLTVVDAIDRIREAA